MVLLTSAADEDTQCSLFLYIFILLLLISSSIILNGTELMVT
jgi:hypothetical protein